MPGGALPAERVDRPAHRDVAEAVGDGDHPPVGVTVREPEQRRRVLAGHGRDLPRRAENLLLDRRVALLRQMRMGDRVIADAVAGLGYRPRARREIADEVPGEEE